ncbi:hypothetical protein VA249_36370 [Vibrio alfacsensis]|uniref:fimbrial biogenesis chaperone n=1 Tax=Vibrio alfacsensis TaxID=1074311 RepID=UPI001BEF8FDA|nr:fimbria/pilus periplasmic chaperone [Vibrio alfacsensis]BBM66991.1 hypothetical protein VA249_36370 [Vibrio alfacsensis]
MRLLLILLSFIGFSTYAFQVEPLIQVVEESGNSSSATFRVENNSSTVLELEIEAMKREVEGRTGEKLSSGSRDFIIMPPMASIEPGDYQVFRAKYLGNKKLSKASSYRIFFRQLPIQDSVSTTSEVKFLFNIGALVFVNPHASSAMLNASLEDELIVLSNEGNGVADLSKYKLSLIASSESMTFPWQQVAKYGSASFLLPGQETTIPISEWYELSKPANSVSVTK